MSQVYEDLNVTYQREKRSREKLDEENKKQQVTIKQFEEEKLHYLSLNENLKKDLLLTQESSRQNEVTLIISSLKLPLCHRKRFLSLVDSSIVFVKNGVKKELFGLGLVIPFFLQHSWSMRELKKERSCSETVWTPLLTLKKISRNI